jgi:hydrogenase/urease accessory protein HupE
MRLAALACALLLGAPSATRAHEVRPAYLELRETAPGLYAVLWRTPVLSGRRLPVTLELPSELHETTPPTERELSDSLVERRVVRAESGSLAGSRIAFRGLEATITDVLVRVSRLDGTSETTLVRPSRPWLELAGAMSPFAVARVYVGHGIEHILLGIDHLLFVLALTLLVPSRRVLFATITAFTLAHSLTLALATLGFVRVPGPPVEATIALSTLLLAGELAHRDRGPRTLTARWPWLVAFGFGLLHGFGFAGALTALGLPQGEVPLALFAFNVGVELGQLAFIAVVLALRGAARRLLRAPATERLALRGASYAIGSAAAFWLCERLAAFAG